MFVLEFGAINGRQRYYTDRANADCSEAGQDPQILKTLCRVIMAHQLTLKCWTDKMADLNASMAHLLNPFLVLKLESGIVASKANVESTEE
jgi:hypothetical protein